MSAKNEKVLLPSPPKSKRVVGYTPIFSGTGYGTRTFDEEEGATLYENKDDCAELYSVGEDDVIAIATVTWEETA